MVRFAHVPYACLIQSYDPYAFLIQSYDTTGERPLMVSGKGQSRPKLRCLQDDKTKLKSYKRYEGKLLSVKLATVERDSACKESHCFHQASSRCQAWSVKAMLQLMAACKACNHLTAHSLEENIFRVLLTRTEMATHAVMSNKMPPAPKLQLSVALLKQLQVGLQNFLIEFPRWQCHKQVQLQQLFLISFVFWARFLRSARVLPQHLKGIFYLFHQSYIVAFKLLV